MDRDAQQIVIPISKTKMIFLLLICFGFAYAGIYMITHSADIIGKVIGYACLIFFGGGSLMGLYRLFQNKPGIILNNDDIVYDTNSQEGFISWNDIDNISISSVKSTKLIMIHPKDVNAFIDKQSSKIKQELMRFNQNNYNAPISLTSSSFQISSDELYSLLNYRLEKSRKDNPG
jgi:hypothetical protein